MGSYDPVELPNWTVYWLDSYSLVSVSSVFMRLEGLLSCFSCVANFLLLEIGC